MWFDPPALIVRKITGLRKPGHAVTRSKDANDRSVYRLAPVAIAGEQ